MQATVAQQQVRYEDVPMMLLNEFLKALKGFSFFVAYQMIKTDSPG